MDLHEAICTLELRPFLQNIPQLEDPVQHTVHTRQPIFRHVAEIRKVCGSPNEESQETVPH